MRVLVLATALLILSHVSIVQADGPDNRMHLLAYSGMFVEEMPDHPRVAGQRIVGVHLSQGEGLFNPEQFRIALGNGVEGRPVCVKISTRDGRYWSLNAFSTEGVNAPFPQIDFRTQFGNRLVDYDLSDFAVRATELSPCIDDIDGAILPAVLGDIPQNTLTLLVNAGNPLSVGARFDYAPHHQFTCQRPAQGVTTGYNYICELPLDGHHGPVAITVGIKDRNGNALTEKLLVQLP